MLFFGRQKFFTNNYENKWGNLTKKNPEFRLQNSPLGEYED